MNIKAMVNKNTYNSKNKDFESIVGIIKVLNGFDTVKTVNDMGARNYD